MIPVLLAAVSEMDEIQTIFYLALVIIVMVVFILIFLAVGLYHWVGLLRDGEHPVIASLIGVILVGILAFMVVTAYFITHSIIVQKGCLRC